MTFASNTCSLAQMPITYELEILRQMLLSREGDRRSGLMMRQGKAWFHISAMGHEALAAAGLQLKPDDLLFPYYRDRALIQAKGMKIEEFARDLLAKAHSGSGGRNMAAHFSSKSANVFSVASPTAAQCLPAVGAAWGLKLAKKSNIVVCGIGDAAVRQGEFYEAVCLAVEKKLPVVFIISDNKFGISTPTREMLPFRLNIFSPDLFCRVDGSDVRALHDVAARTFEKARQGHGPSLLWCELDRLESHTSADDHRLYRSATDIQSMKDPIALYAATLVEEGKITQEQVATLQENCASEVADIYARIEKDPNPDPLKSLTYLYGTTRSETSVPLEFSGELTMVEALNRTFHIGLEKRDDLIFLGQDIEDPKGGVFGLTKGLSSKFPDRVYNSPLAEATILGAGVGLAVAGWKPVLELQFIDFMGPGFNQLVTQIATLRWRSAGQWKCPMVIYAPYGAYLPAGGIWHSQSNEGIWAHIPGLRVAIPSTPEDVAALFWSAFEETDPSLILIPKHLMRKRRTVAPIKMVRFGEARLRRSGEDVTLVSWGNCLELAEEAAAHFQEQGVSLEIIDLRSVTPCDWETIDKSLEKTGRLVVLHEDNRTCGFGAAIITEMVSYAHSFRYLKAEPQLVARADVHVPFCPDLEYAVLPDLADVISAVENTLRK